MYLKFLNSNKIIFAKKLLNININTTSRLNKISQKLKNQKIINDLSFSETTKKFFGFSLLKSNYLSYFEKKILKNLRKKNFSKIKIFWKNFDIYKDLFFYKSIDITLGGFNFLRSKLKKKNLSLKNYEKNKYLQRAISSPRTFIQNHSLKKKKEITMVFFLNKIRKNFG